MFTDDFAKGEHVDGEVGWTQHRALRDTTGDFVGVRPCFTQAHVFCSASQARNEPVVSVLRVQCCIVGSRRVVRPGHSVL